MQIVKCVCGANLKVNEKVDLSKSLCPKCGSIIKAEGKQSAISSKVKGKINKANFNKNNYGAYFLALFVFSCALVVLLFVVYSLVPKKDIVVEPVNEWKFVLSKPDNFFYVHMGSAGVAKNGGAVFKTMLSHNLALFSFLSESKIIYILNKVGVNENNIEKFIWSHRDNGDFSSVVKVSGKISPLVLESKLQPFDIIKDIRKIQYFEKKNDREIEKIKNTPIRDLFLPSNKTINQLESEMSERYEYVKLLEKKHFSEFEVENVGGTELYRKKTESIYFFSDQTLDKLVFAGYKNIGQVINVDNSFEEASNDIYNDCKSGKYFIVFNVSQQNNPLGKEFYSEAKSLLYLRPILEFKNAYVKMSGEDGALVINLNVIYQNKKSAEIAMKWIKELPRTLPVIFNEPNLKSGFDGNDKDILFFAEKIANSKFIIKDNELTIRMVVKN